MGLMLGDMPESVVLDWFSMDAELVDIMARASTTAKIGWKELFKITTFVT